MLTTALYTGDYLGPFMRPLTDLLSYLSSEIGEGYAPSPTSLLGKYQIANNVSWQRACDLVLQGSLPARGANFAGPGAQAFLRSVQRLLLTTDHTLGLLNQVETSISAYTTTVISHCNREDGNLSALELQLQSYCNLRPDVEAALLLHLPQHSVAGMIHEIIRGATLASVTQDGTASDLLGSFDTLYSRTLDTMTQDFQNAGKVIPSIGDFPLNVPAERERDVIAAFDLLSQELQMILKHWASQIQQDTATFLQELTRLEAPERLNLNTSPITVERTPFNLSLAEPRQRDLANQFFMPNGAYGLGENVAYSLPRGGTRATGWGEPDNLVNDVITPGDLINPLGNVIGGVPTILRGSDPGNTQQDSGIPWVWNTITGSVSDDGTVWVIIAAGGGENADGGYDPGLILPYPFRVRGNITYTLKIPVTWDPSHTAIPYLPPNTGPYPPPTIRNIKHSVTVFGGNNPDLVDPGSLNFSVSSSIEVYSGNGTLLQTVVGAPGGTAHSIQNLEYTWQDLSQIQTTVPYQLHPWGSYGPWPNTNMTLFRLKHVMWVLGDSGYEVPTSPLPVNFHDVDRTT